MEWFVLKDGARQGPIASEELRSRLEHGELPRAVLVWCQGLEEWVPAQEAPGLLCPPATPPTPPSLKEADPESAPSAIDSNKSPFDPLRPRRLRGSYLRRHWRGDLPLPVSYWVNAILLSIGLTLAAMALNEWLRRASWPLAAPVVGIGWSIVVAAVSVWQLVGTWRSAGKYRAGGGRALWAYLAQFMLVIGVLRSTETFAREVVPQVTASAQIIGEYLGLGPAQYSVAILRPDSEVEIRGFISLGLSQELERVLKAHPGLTTVHLNSEGGRIGEARRLRDVIANHGLNTHTSTGCISACTIPFMAGERRTLAVTAALGFHLAVFPFPGVSDQQVRQEQAPDRQYFIARGVSEGFVARMYSTTEIWRPTRLELFQAGVITELSPPD